MEPGGQTVGVDEKQLTPREFEVAILMAHGHTNQEVADRLVISVRTAESHRRNLMAKLSARRARTSSAGRSTVSFCASPPAAGARTNPMKECASSS